MEKEETNQSETIRLVRIDQLPASHWLNQCNFGFSLADITLLSISTHQMRASWQRFLEMIDCNTLMDIKTEKQVLKSLYGWCPPSFPLDLASLGTYPQPSLSPSWPPSSSVSTLGPGPPGLRAPVWAPRVSECLLFVP